VRGCAVRTAPRTLHPHVALAWYTEHPLDPRLDLRAAGGFVQKSRPTQNKRARERARQEKQQQKAARRQEKSQRPTKPTREGGEDPDIAGIVPGPQPSPWGDE
jgi:hypothetical protein